MKWTLPPAKQQFTPPACRLRAMAEVMSVPEVVQPIPRAAVVGLQYRAPFCSSSPPSSATPPSKLLGVGLYDPRPAFTMLEPGNPRAHTPRGSTGDNPARS